MWSAPIITCLNMFSSNFVMCPLTVRRRTSDALMLQVISGKHSAPLSGAMSRGTAAPLASGSDSAAQITRWLDLLLIMSWSRCVHGPCASMTFCHAHGIGRTTCYDLINSGKIRSVMIGGRRVIPIEEGEKLLNPQT